MRVDFAAHARSLGASVEDVRDSTSVADLAAAYARAREAARATRRPSVVVCRVHPTTWTESGAWWEVGVPSSLSGHAGVQTGRSKQLRWLAGDPEVSAG